MNIGFFLGYGPQVKLGNQGLGRYIGGLIKGFVARESSVFLVAPSWLRESIESLFREFAIPADKVTIYTPKHDPIVWRMYKWLVLGKKHKSINLSGILAKYYRKAALSFTRMSTQNLAAYLPLFFLIFLFCLLLSPLLLVIGGVLIGTKKALGAIRGKTDHLKEKDTINSQNDSLYLEVFDVLNDAVIDMLIKKINKSNDCDIWYVPSLFWPQVNKIKHPVVINAPDLVSAIYAAEFSMILNSLEATQKVKKTIEGGKYFITYSEYIRKTTLLTDYGKKPQNVIAIRHVNNSSKQYINVNNQRNELLGTKREYDVELSHAILNKMKCNSCPSYYAEHMNFNDLHYIFYASQIRPHKNMITLLKAFEYLLREKHIQIKLILTGTVLPETDDSVNEYIYEHHLEKEVLAFSGVSATTLSALYRCADLVVNPSMYEGGFTFTFGEGMSVGTPSLMANMPFEMEILEPAGLEDCTFNPTDWMELAKKIEYWLPRRKELYEKELPLYKELEKRTPEVVAGEYEEALRTFAKMEQEERSVE